MDLIRFMLYCFGLGFHYVHPCFIDLILDLIWFITPAQLIVYINAHFSRQLPIGVPRKSRNALFRVFGHIFVVEKVKKGFKMSYLFLRAKISTWIGPNVQVYLKDIATVYLKKKKIATVILFLFINYKGWI